MTTFWVLGTILAPFGLDSNNPELSEGERVLIYLALVPGGSLLIADWKTCPARSDKRKTKNKYNDISTEKWRITHLKKRQFTVDPTEKWLLTYYFEVVASVKSF